MDGSLGGHTAALLEPYADDPGNSGLPRYETAKLNDMAKERVLAGFQLGFTPSATKGFRWRSMLLPKRKKRHASRR
jgi:hypothetical protein